MPRYGGDLNSMLFRLSTDIDDDSLEERIIKSIEDFEPRAKILNINSIISPDENEVKVTVFFQVVNTAQQVQVEVSLTRLR